VEILITPPLWFRWWSFMTLGMLILIMVITLIRIRERNLRNRALELERKVEEQTRQIISQRNEVDEMKTQFYTNVSHEFRTPLTLILGPMEDALKKKGGLIDFERTLVEIMRRNAKRLQRLINQLLDITKLEAGKMNIEVAECKLTDFVRTLSSSFTSLAESKKISFLVDLQEARGVCFADTDKVEKILVNLLSNAFKYTEEEGEVRLRMNYLFADGQTNPQSVVFKVEDTGRGIASEHLPKIFDRYYHAGPDKTREDESFGIGLALTRELTETLHGKIEVESQPGIGTVFTVTLPVSKESFKPGEFVVLSGEEPEIAQERQERGGEEKSGREGPEGSHRFEILVVEDNRDLRTYIKQMLRKDYTIREAGNGKIGLDMALDHIPDLIISDLMMPVMSGTEMCSLLKSDDRTSHIPVIFLTARADKQSKIEGLNTRADDYIVKPFNSLELLARVKALLRIRDLMQANADKEKKIDALTRKLQNSYSYGNIIGSSPPMKKMGESGIAKEKLVRLSSFSML
jgi:signal transduction histidine kinase/FixJ family two-component response regulator